MNNVSNVNAEVNRELRRIGDKIATSLSKKYPSLEFQILPHDMRCGECIVWAINDRATNSWVGKYNFILDERKLRSLNHMAGIARERAEIVCSRCHVSFRFAVGCAQDYAEYRCKGCNNVK
jgi:Fe-S cluster biosynthesis and repair protein YggX